MNKQEELGYRKESNALAQDTRFNGEQCVDGTGFRFREAAVTMWKADVATGGKIIGTEEKATLLLSEIPGDQGNVFRKARWSIVLARDGGHTINAVSAVYTIFLQINEHPKGWLYHVKDESGISYLLRIEHTVSPQPSQNVATGLNTLRKQFYRTIGGN